MKLIYCTSLAFSDKLANRVQVRSMAKAFQKKLNGDFYLGVNYKDEEEKDIKIVCFNASKSYILAWRYLRFIKENKIGYVYCREARLLFFIILFNIFFWRLKLKFIYEIHALLKRNATDGMVDRFLSARVNKLVFITRALRDMYMAEYKTTEQKTLICPDAVDLSIFNIDISKEQAAEKLGLPKNKKFLVYTGKFKTMGMDKGIADILEALKILENKDIIFIAVGGSEEDIDYYLNLVSTIGLKKDKVFFYGLSPQSNLAVFQKAADVLLMPFPKNEHYTYFMSPLKMFEYMAAKRPIIASDLSSTKEILNEQNAVFCQPDNPSDLARAIVKVLNDYQYSESISQRAYRDVQNYTWAKRVEKILQFIGR